MTENPTVVELSAVTKRFTLDVNRSVKERVLFFSRRGKDRRTFIALDDVALTIHSGETVGLLGHNGSGKSTLLKVIGGILEPNTGVVKRRGRVAALLELGAGFHPDLSGRENVYLNAALLGMTKLETEKAFDDIVEFSEIGDFIDTQVKFYSSGMYVRLAFAVAVHSDPDILLVDEVLAVGDEPFQRKCLSKIREFQTEGRTIIFVSHSADAVADICSRAVVLDRGHIVFDGEVREGIDVLRDGFEQARVRRLERKAAELPESATGRPDLEEAAASVGEARLVSADIVDGDLVSVEGRILEAGADLHIRIRFSSSGKSPVSRVGFSLLDEAGKVAYRTGTFPLDLDVPTEPGLYEVDFSLPQVNLSGQRYSLSCALRDHTGADLAELRDAAWVDIAPDRIASGVAQLAVSAVIRGLTDAT
jgi:ABC-2 type transport system ATP-binding protein